MSHGYLNDPSDPWWRHAVVYQVYVRSFADSDGDGVGDLPGITSRLPYLRDLGVDALWITPFYTSPQHDHGYDVADYSDVDPLFGTLADADALLARAHDLGLRVIVDLVPNHTSDEHAWFQAALAAAPGQPGARALPVPRGPRPRRRRAARTTGSRSSAARPGPGSTDGQWYLHLFDSTQPDLDWRNPEVGDMFEDVLRFWLDRGRRRLPRRRGARPVQGGEPARPGRRRAASEPVRRGTSRPLDGRARAQATSRCGTSPRCTTSTAAGTRSSTSTTATGWPSPRPGPRPPSRWPRFVRPDELRPGVQLRLAARRLVGRRPSPRSSPARSPRVGPVGAAADLGAQQPRRRPPPRPATAAARSGLARARAATLAMLALPGSSYLYQGEELGLEQVDVAPGGPAGPVVVPHRRARPRRLPGADPVGRRRSRRSSFGPGDRPAVDPAARRAGPTLTVERPDRRTRARRWRSTARRWRPGASTR